MKLAVRTASGLAFLLVFVGALVLGVPYLSALLTLILLLGLWEYRRLWQAVGIDPPLWLLGPLAIFWLWRYAYPQLSSLSLGLEVAVLLGLAATLVRRSESRPFASWAVAVGGAIWLGFLAGFLLLLFHAVPDRQRAVELVLLTVGISVLSDTLAYLVGSWIGSHPLAPKVSPNKTWEGAIAGWAGATLMVALVLPLVLPAVGHPLSLGIGALGAVAAQLGDLVESHWKREMGAKDSGSFLPGHGGILDRVDSVLFVSAVVYSLLGVAHGF